MQRSRRQRPAGSEGLQPAADSHLPQGAVKIPTLQKGIAILTETKRLPQTHMDSAAVKRGKKKLLLFLGKNLRQKMKSIPLIGLVRFHPNPVESLSGNKKQAVRFRQKELPLHPVLHPAAEKIIDFIKAVAMQGKGHVGISGNGVMAGDFLFLQLFLECKGLPSPFRHAAAFF